MNPGSQTVEADFEQQIFSKPDYFNLYDSRRKGYQIQHVSICETSLDEFCLL